MSLDAQHTRLTGIGRITIGKDGIAVEGFDADNATCRDVCVLALVWAIGELQRELMADIERPGGSERVWDATEPD